MRTLYATDASVYREMPQAVAMPKTEGDICKLVRFAREHGTSLIPRTAGTSLAGQVVGAGIVVDVSRHFTRIVEIDATRRRVRVQPGVVRNELNLALAPHGLFFAPETSTQNRCMIGGMVGNNACGANSVVYGSTREHLVSVRAVLSDGSIAEFGVALAGRSSQRNVAVIHLRLQSTARLTVRSGTPTTGLKLNASFQKSLSTAATPAMHSTRSRPAFRMRRMVHPLISADYWRAPRARWRS